MIRFGRRRPRLTARLRLTALFGVVVIVSGAGLLTLNYVLVDQSLTRNRDEVMTALRRRVDPSRLRDANIPEQLRALLEAGKTPPFPVSPEGRRIFEAVQNDITQAHLDRLLVQSLIALGVMSFVSIGLGWLVAGRVLRPVHKMTATARRLSDSNLHERFDLRGPHDELKELAETFDAMLDRLESAFESQRRFVADASHELRTPLSVIRAEVEVALADPNASTEELRETALRVLGATERSERLVDSLLALARSDAAPRGDEPCDLAEIAGVVVDRASAEADALGLGLGLEIEPAPIVGDRVLLDRMVENLVVNAVRHNESGGWLTVRTHRRDGGAVVCVTNTGRRVEPHEVDQLVRRFHTSVGSKTRGHRGFGLGLSIVESVARAHGGAVTLRARPEGGLEVVVELADAAPDQPLDIGPAPTELATR